jgi:hypothetical protein
MADSEDSHAPSKNITAEVIWETTLGHLVPQKLQEKQCLCEQGTPLFFFS